MRTSTKPLTKLICPYCKNDKIYISIDFKFGRNRKGLAKCIKKIDRPGLTKKFLKPKIIGCGKKFIIKFSRSNNDKRNRHIF